MVGPSWKRRLVIAAMVAAGFWPLVHMGLVARYDMSPWKLGGWGMYSEPRLRQHGMEVFGRVPGGRWERMLAPSRSVQMAAGPFLEEYRWLRGLTSASDFVAALREDRPAWEEFRIVVDRAAMDRETGMIEFRQAIYHHPEGEWRAQDPALSPGQAPRD